MSKAEPFTAEELDAMRKELAAYEANYLSCEQMDSRWIATIDALSARVARLEAALRFYAEPSGYLPKARTVSVVSMDGGARARAALEPTQSGSERSDEEDKS